MKVSSAADMIKFGTILGVWAHPDDETWSMAGIAMLARQNGQRVVCITATRGELGSKDEQRWPISTLGKIREHELEEAFKILDITEHYWLDYPDGGCLKCSASEAVGKIAKIMADVHPDTIFTFGPDGATGHDDHKTVSAWTKVAANTLDYEPAIYRMVESREWYEKSGKELDAKFDIFFNIDEPPLVEEDKADLQCCLGEELIKLKLDALKAQVSQTEDMFKDDSLKSLRDNADTELFMRM